MIIFYIFLLTKHLFSRHGDRYVLEIDQSTLGNVHKFARDYGYDILGQSSLLPDVYFLRSKGPFGFKRSGITTNDTSQLTNYKRVFKELWKIREPRGVIYSSISNETSDVDVINIRDPYFYKQWYLKNAKQIAKDFTLDINILPAWNRGFNGNGVTIAVLDDGIDYENPDIHPNFNKALSFDFQDYDDDPMPPEYVNSSHGTRCASVTAGAKNNFCGVGVAYKASIVGIRMLDDRTTDSIEASALSYKNDKIDIYSCSWGPRDDGLRFGRPGPLTTKVLRMGAIKGRNGLGSIFVWSSGNGALNGDDCNADGYVTSIYTIIIGSVSSQGDSSVYSETCSSILAVTFGGSTSTVGIENAIINSDMNDECRLIFEGSSVSSSIAAGLIALMLQANPMLTWRDIQHIIVETAQIVSPADGGWSRNGAGKWYNPKFGFGRLDALLLVDSAYQWKPIAADHKKCRIKQNLKKDFHIYKGGTVIFNIEGSKCLEKGSEDTYKSNVISKVEHVQIILTLSHICRGRVDIMLISPSGTKSQLLKPRFKDTSRNGLQEWIFKSVHFWGESPQGLWSLAVSDNILVDPCEYINNTLSRNTSETTTKQPIELNLSSSTVSANKTLAQSSNVTNKTTTTQYVEGSSKLKVRPEPQSNVSLTSGNSLNLSNLYEVVKQFPQLLSKAMNNFSKDTLNTKQEKVTTPSLNDDQEYYVKKSKKSNKLGKFEYPKNKVYERILVEKIRVKPDKKKKKNHRKNIKIEKEFTEDVVDNDEDGGSYETQRDIRSPSKMMIKSRLDQELHSKLKEVKDKRSKISKKSKSKHHKWKSAVGSVDSWTLIIYGT